MNPLVSSKIIPFFYFIFGIVFIFIPKLPLSDISDSSLTFTNVLEGVLRGVGVIFLVFAILVSRIFVISKSVYRLLNSTFIFIFILMSFVGIIIYFTVPKRPIELLLFTGINISFF